MAPRLYDYFERALSWHYLNGIGADLWGTLGATGDDAYAAVKESVRQRLVNRCKDEALPWIAQTFHLGYPARLTVAQVRGYLTDPWTHWENAGTRDRLLDELGVLGYLNCQIITYRDLVDAGSPDTVFGGKESFFYVIIKKPNPWAPSGKWGLPPLGSGALWGAAPFTWGSTASWSEIEEIRRVIEKWKPATTSCRFIEAWLEVTIFGNPLTVVRWPVHEPWEQAQNGAYRSFYNYAFDRE